MKIRLPLLILILVFGLSTLSWAKGLPLSLRKLYTGSELIVVAKVDKSSPIKRDKNTRYDTKVNLTIILVIKGELEDKTITVLTTTLKMCPPPAVYPEGKTVLAFLNHHGKHYTTYGHFDGAKVLTEKRLEVYLMRLREIEGILKIKDKKKQEKAVVEWLVKCAENPVTRWEGVFDLTYRYSYPRYDPDFLRLLTKEQKKRLADVLFATDPADIGKRQGDYLLIESVAGWGDQRLIPFLLKYLETKSDRYYPHFAAPVMRLIAENLDSVKAKELVKAFEAIPRSGKQPDIAKMKSILQEFIQVVKEQIDSDSPDKK